ncbi:hypothetical protein I4U23_004699 [Adineta vaga]|nr:hypothetical protein I4U23_004699 [Adineta vaga]
MIHDKEINDGDRIQKPNIYNKYLPFYDTLQHQIPEAFDEIKMRLSQTIQLIEIEPGFSLWSTKLSDFILLYGYSFTKTDHIKLINFYLSVLSIENLNYVHVKTCFDLLEVLLRKVELITRNELTIDWRILYHWGRIIRFHHDQDYSLEIMPNNIELSFCDCVGLSCYYFSETATQEMLDEFRPWLCPFDTSCDDAMYIFHHFLPVNLPPELHHQGFKLWLPELLGIWESISSSTNWQSYFIPTFSCIAWNNIGYIDWEPWIPQIFTRFLRDLSLPVGALSTTSQNITYLSSAMASLMVAMIGNGGSCLQYVKDLFTAIKSFYHPSNTGDFQQYLVNFLSELATKFVERVYLTSVVSVIVQQCSEKLFEVVRKKITNFLAVPSIGSNVDNSVTYILVRPILQTNPIETLKYLLPQTCERIEKILDDWEATIFTDYQGDPELTWYVVLFSELLQARGDTLLIYKPIILSVFHRCVQLIHKESYNAMANAAQYLLRSLSNAYPIEYRLTLENIDEPFTDFLPIRAWGKHVELDNLKPQFHIPNAEEISFACDIVETFLYRELTFLNEKDSCISKDERLRSLTLLSSIIIGCLRMVPSVDSEEVPDLVPTLVSLESQYKTPCSIYPCVPKFKENLRRRIINDLGNLLDHLIDKHPDDAASISFALQIYALSPCYYGVLADEYDGAFADFDTAIYSFESEINSKQCYPRFVMIRRLVEQMNLLSLHHNEPFTEIDKQVVIKLAELSMNRYCGIRMNAQQSLFVLLTRFQFSYEVIIDRLLELLNASNEINHDEFKGCLYILLGTDFVFLPGKHSWKLLEKLWPSIAKTTHVTKTSTQDLILQIVYKISQQFDAPSIIEETNIAAIRAAAALWRPLDAQEMKISIENREKRTQENIQSYNNLIGDISFSTSDTHLTWQQQQRMVYLLGQLFQKKVPLSTSFIQTGLDLFVHDNVELRSLACNYIAAVCRLQKLPRIYVEKTRDEIMHRTINDECHPGDRDDNLWVTLNDYKPPKTQIEWEESCFLDKSFHGYYQWPKIIRYPINKRDRYTQGNMPEQVAIIYDRFVDKTFLTHAIQLMVSDLDGGNGFNVHRYRMFKGLFRNFGEAFVDNFMEILYTLMHEQTTEKQEASSQLAAEIVAGIIRGSKYWTIEMHNELWLKLTPFLNKVCANLSWEVVTSWYYCFWHVLGDADPRRMYRVIEFLLSLMNIPSTANGISETSRWYLVKILSNCEWHIPKVWHAVSTYAKELLDHPHSAVRERIISIFNRAFYCDVTLPNGQSTRHPNMNLFLSFVRKRLQEAMDICEKSSRVDSSDEVAKIVSERQQALVFIETVIELYIKILSGCLQPIKRGMIELFPELCNLENIVSHDEDLQVRLTLSRTTITTLHIQVPFLEEFIEQIECVIKSDKWHARRAAIEFIQYLIFGNLFNARPFSPRIRKIVLGHLSDEQLEVRTIASVTLAGLYQCNFIPITKEDLEYFCWMSKTKYSIKVDDKKITLTENIIKRHGGVLGLCAMVLSAPYDIPLYIPDALMQMCEHLQDPILIRESVKYALAEFRRTHHDSWHEHREKFTNEQLVILTDVLISPSYYA